MSKSQNTKNEQQKDLCITSEQLTEQWKKGELPEGWYYVKCDDGICFDRFTYYGGFSKIFNYSVKQILAPVPTFDELQNMNKAVNECMAANIKLVEENAQLKELLKDARNVLKMVDTYYGDYDSTKGFLIVERIDEALK